jgi:hypothetical protein
MVYRRAAISPFPRALLATSMIGLFFIPVAQFSRCLLSNRYRCFLLKPGRPERLPDKVPILPNLTPPSCLSDRWEELPRVSGVPTFPAPTLCAVFFSFWRGSTTPQNPVPHFPKAAGNPGCSFHNLQSENLPNGLVEYLLASWRYLLSQASVPYAAVHSSCSRCLLLNIHHFRIPCTSSFWPCP